MTEPLTLYGESSWVSPWVFHAMVALEEKRLPYKLEIVPLPIPEPKRTGLATHALIGKVPILVHGDTWISESLAISEYLAEMFPTPGHPRLFPADLRERARARQIMSYLRTSLFALREDRPTSGVFGRPSGTAMSDHGRAEAAELVRIATAAITGGTSMFAAWCIADTDLALALMRLVASSDPLPQPLVDYALAQFDRTSVRTYLAHLPTGR